MKRLNNAARVFGHVLNYTDVGFTLDGLHRAVLRAAVRCLSPAETCDCLRFHLSADAYARKVLVERVSEQCAEQLLPVHVELVGELLSPRQTTPRTHPTTLSYVLGRIAASLPLEHPVALEILAGLIRSSRRAWRRAAYKSLKHLWRPLARGLVERAWQDHAEPEASHLLLLNSSPSDLRTRVDEFLGRVPDWQYRQLILKVAAEFPEVLGEVWQNEPSTAFYVHAKLRLPVPRRMVPRMRAFADSAPDWLVVWSAGQLADRRLVRAFIEYVESLER